MSECKSIFYTWNKQTTLNFFFLVICEILSTWFPISSNLTTITSLALPSVQGKHFTLVKSLPSRAIGEKANGSNDKVYSVVAVVNPFGNQCAKWWEWLSATHSPALFWLQAYISMYGWYTFQCPGSRNLAIFISCSACGEWDWKLPYFLKSNLECLQLITITNIHTHPHTYTCYHNCIHFSHHWKQNPLNISY